MEFQTPNISAHTAHLPRPASLSLFLFFFHPFQIPKAWLKQFYYSDLCKQHRSLASTEKGINSPLKVLLVVIKANEKMRCKEPQPRVHMNCKVWIQAKYWELLLLGTTFLENCNNNVPGATWFWSAYFSTAPSAL